MEKIYLRPEIIENGSLNASYILNPNSIKTINGASILGSGNIEISAGGVYESGKNINISSYAISTVDNPDFDEITVGYICINDGTIKLQDPSDSILLAGGPENILFNFDSSASSGDSLSYILDHKANDDSVMHTTGDENISGNKTFLFGSTVSLFGGAMATTRPAYVDDTSIATTEFVHAAISYDTAALISRIEYLETVISYIVNIDAFALRHSDLPEEIGELAPGHEITDLGNN